MTSGTVADRAFLFNIFRNDDPTLQFETDELLVCEFGDSAIVTGRLTATRDGAIASQQRFSHYFVKRDGRCRSWPRRGRRCADTSARASRA